MQRHSDSLRQALLIAYEQGERSPTALARHFGVSAPWVYRLLDEHRPSAQPKQPGGRPHRLDDKAVQLLQALVAEHPSASLPVLCQLLAARGGPVVSESMLWRALRRLGFQRQATPRTAVTSTQLRFAVAQPRPVMLQASGLARLMRPISRAPAAQRQRYDTDLTDAEWALLEPLLPAHKPGGRKPKYSLREIVNGIRYVLRTGAAWRHVPHDLPHWEACWHYFRTWRQQRW